ncbi:MAG: hypothetical protein AAFO95_10285, partial [Cyanobacteria bacterium J06600_6]
YLMKIWKIIVSILLFCSLTSCKQLQFSNLPNSDFNQESSELSSSSSDLREVTIPRTISELEKNLEQYNPVVEIISPQTGEIFEQANIEIELKVTDLPLFQDDRLKLGNHLAVVIDNETLLPIYDLEKPTLVDNLTPGTHTLRAFAVKPWGESFKTQGAYAQTTFNVLTETNSNEPDVNQPLLTYNSPLGTYGAEPILLDFYLKYPEFVSGKNINNTKNTSVKATINGTSFIVKKWQPYYLTGFKQGENWVQLELIDELGNSIENTFNNTVRVFNYDPQQQDALAKLVTNKIPIAEAKSIVEQNYYIQPVESLEIFDDANVPINVAESDLNIGNSEQKNISEQLPTELAPAKETNKNIDLEAEEAGILTDTPSITEPQDGNLQIPLTKVEQETELEKSDLEKRIELQENKQSVSLKSTIQQNSSVAESELVDNVNIKVVPQDDIVSNINTPQQPQLKTDVSQADSLQISKSNTPEQITPTSSELSVNNAVKNAQIEEQASDLAIETRSPVAKTGERAIAVSPPRLEQDLPVSETGKKFLWWKKLLVNIRHQLESLAKKLPSEV